jgi:hypothetical protein
MIPDKRSSGKAPRGSEAALKARAEQQLISGRNWLAKTSLIQSHKIEGCSLLRNHAGSHKGHLGRRCEHVRIGKLFSEAAQVLSKFF